MEASKNDSYERALNDNFLNICKIYNNKKTRKENQQHIII